MFLRTLNRIKKKLQSIHLICWFLILTSSQSQLFIHCLRLKMRTTWVFLLADLKAGLQQHSAPESSDSFGSVTLAAFHGHIDFSPTLQIIAGCCESYPPSADREEPLHVDMRALLSDLRKVIFWHLIDCNWRLCTSCPCNECIFNRLSGELSSALLGFCFTDCKLASLKYNYKLWPEHVLWLNNALNV